MYVEKEGFSMPRKPKEIRWDRLRATVNPNSLKITSTVNMKSLPEGVLGQERAREALKFGMEMASLEYNIYLAGEPNTGLTYIAKNYLKRAAKDLKVPPDWCYVHNFEKPDSPRPIFMSAGMGKKLQRDIDELVKSLASKIPQVFDSDDYRAKEAEVKQVFERNKKRIIEELSQRAKGKGFILQFSQVGMMIIPATKTGEPMSQEELSTLSEKDKNDLRKRGDDLQVEMNEAIKMIRREEESFEKKRSRLDNEIAHYVVGTVIEHLRDKYENEEDALKYMDEVKEDIFKNIEDFKKKPEDQPHGPIPIPMPMPTQEQTFKRYKVNVFIDNSDTKGAPVIIESNPNYLNLFGSVERVAVFGALVTDFTMIKPGALHKANGGYLIIKVLDLLRYGFPYEALKRALRDGEIKIEDPSEFFGLFSTKTIKPGPIPLDVKVVFTGSNYLYQLLYIYDEAFPELFKVKAHLDNQMDANVTNFRRVGAAMGQFCRDSDLKHLDATGVAKLAEYSMELTGDRKKLSLEIGHLADVVKEAEYYANMDKEELINREYVAKAIKSRKRRRSLIEERVKEYVKRDILWVETDGYKVGQVNGLAVLSSGDHTFGKPNRITATVYLGKSGVTDIEREAKLGGSLHTKGVMILSSYIRENFGQDKTISLAASLAFEQSYGMVEGDSASAAELFALISALSEKPIFQGLAVTGSVSQKGEIQPIGGVSQKIEGFFDICNHKGLTGSQGVVIPDKNVANLMLKDEVVEAVKEKKFHIYPISTIGEGLEILIGMRAGKKTAKGVYPKGTLYNLVDERLKKMEKLVKEKEKEAAKGNNEEESLSCPECGK